MAVTLDIEGSVEKISANARQLKMDLTGVAEAYDLIGEAEADAVASALKGQKQVQDGLRKTNKDYTKQEGIIEGLEKQLERLNKGQKKANDPAIVKKYNTEIAKTEAALKLAKGQSIGFFAALRGGATASEAVFLSLKGVLASTFAPLFAATAVLGTLREVISLSNQFQQSGADLQAITGASADTLEFLKQEAVEVGVETTISANQTLEAYKLIASAKPELLDNAAGLASITREAVTLAEAMGGDLPTAATNLTDIMNQFNAPAEQAGRFTNALAAGSKEGSAEVGQLAAAFLVAGTELNSANVEFEEGVGLLETLAERGKKGSEAGTALRNVVSKLSATDVLPKDAVTRLEAAGVNMGLLSDKSLSFTDRLRALQPVQNDANALVSVFGLENKAAAQILLNNIDRTEELTAAVTDTNVAQEQAAIRTATASGEWAKLSNTIQSLVVDNGSGLSGFLAFLIRFVREGVLFLKGVIDDIKPSVNVVVDAFGNLFDVIRNLLPAAQEGEEKFNLLGLVINSISLPIKLVANLLAALVNGLAYFYKSAAEAVNKSAALTGFFRNLRLLIVGVFSAISDAPAYIDGGIASVKTFVGETIKSVVNLGKNIGDVLVEAFNVKKLITKGTGDLEAALDKVLVNPFKGVGDKAAKAFNEGFAASQRGVKIAAPESTGGGTVAAPVDAGGVVDAGFSQREEERKKAAEKAAREAEKAAQEEKRRLEEIARLRLDALRDGTEKELALEEKRFADLKAKLDKYNLDTTQAAQQHELNKYAIREKGLNDIANLENLTGEERIRFIYEQQKKEIDALEANLRNASNGELVESQIQQLNLLRKNANDQFLNDLTAFQDEELKKAQEHEIALLELEADGFKTQAEFEEFKQKEILDIKLRYAEEQLAILEKTQGAESGAALALRKTINEIKGELEGLTGGTAKEFNLFDLVGLDPNDPKAKGIETFVKGTVDLLEDFNKQRLESAQAAIDASDAEIAAIQENIDAKEEELTKAIERGDEGFANREAEVQKEIDLLKAQQEAEKVEREKAFNEKKKLQKQQAIIDTVTQASSLITAAAQIFQSVAAIPFVGVALGAALVAAMIGSFIAAKAKVFQGINKQKAAKGMYGLVKGRRHSEGGERFGDHIEVEDGEAFGVLSRQATRRYNKYYEAFTNAANKNDRRKMAEIARQLGVSGIDRTLPSAVEKYEGKLIQVKTEYNATLNSSDLRENNTLLRKLIAKDKAPKTDYLNDGSRVERHGNHTRIIRKKTL